MSMFFIDPYKVAPPAETDPYFANVVLLLHGNGVNGAQVFTDNGPLELVPSGITGTVQTSTTQSEYGGSSIYSAGAGTPGNTFAYTPGGGPFAFGTGDFTIEFSIYDQNTITTNNGVFCSRATFGEAGWLVQRGGGPAVYYTGAGDAPTIGALITAGAWTKVAFSKVGSTIYAFTNGVLSGSTAHTSNSTVGSFFYVLKLGWINGNFQGYIDEVRITKGVGRYTASYTPRTTPFPDF